MQTDWSVVIRPAVVLGRSWRIGFVRASFGGGTPDGAESANPGRSGSFARVFENRPRRILACRCNRISNERGAVSGEERTSHFKSTTSCPGSFPGRTDSDSRPQVHHPDNRVSPAFQARPETVTASPDPWLPPQASRSVFDGSAGREPRSMPDGVQRLSGSISGPWLEGRGEQSAIRLNSNRR